MTFSLAGYDSGSFHVETIRADLPGFYPAV